MSGRTTYDALIIGAGPNGLAAAVRLALEGLSVKVYEAGETVGGGTRTLELMEPGFYHDICSAIHPMGSSSPFFNALPLERFGLEWIHPEYPLAHPLDHGPAILQHRSLPDMKGKLDEDYESYEELYKPLADGWSDLAGDILAPFRFPRNPFRMASFGLKALQPSTRFARHRFRGERARALFAGMAAHSIQPLEKPLTAALGLVFGAAAHACGWPLARGGSGSITTALARYLETLGGEIDTRRAIDHLDELPRARAILFNLTPRQVLRIAGERFPAGYRRKLERYRYGAGVFKIDYILKEPVPWRDPQCNQAGTVHLGGTLEEIAHSERTMQDGRHAERPFVLVAQQSPFDPTRTPDHRHTLWAYCHVPHGSDRDMTREIENQIERYAPGFRDVVARRVTRTASEFQSYNANYIGGDINGGVQDLRQLFTRPVDLLAPYATPASDLFFCSSSTPPGGGVHGMSGYHAAELVLKRVFGRRRPDLKFRL